MDIELIVKKVIDGTITEDELLNLTKQKLLLTKYNDKPIIDYILEYKRNTENFDDSAIYNSDIAKKYLDSGLGLSYYVSEEILLSKYNDEKTILEKYLEDICDKELINKISELIAQGNNLREILRYRINDKSIYEQLDDNISFCVFDIIALNDETIFLDIINSGQDIDERVYVYNIFNKNVLSLKINDNERVVDMMLAKIFGDKGIVEELKQYINNDMSLDISALKRNNSPLLARLENEHNEGFKMLRKTLWWFVSLQREKVPQQEDCEKNPVVFSPLDLMLMSNMDISYYDKKALDSPEFAKVYAKHKRWNILSSAKKEVLKTEYNGMPIYEHLLINGIECTTLDFDAQHDPQIASIYAKYPLGGKVLEHASQKFLETEYNGMPIYEYLVMNRIKSPTFDFEATYDPKIALVYAKHKRWDILRKANSHILETIYDGKAIVAYIYEYLAYGNISEQESVETYLLLRKHSKSGIRIVSAEAGNAGLNISVVFYDIALQNESFLLEPFMQNPNESKLDKIIKDLLETKKINQLAHINPTGALLTFRAKNLNDKMIIEYIIENFRDSFRFDLVPVETYLYVSAEGIRVLDFLANNYHDFLSELVAKYPSAFSDRTIATILNSHGIKPPIIEIPLHDDDKRQIKQNVYIQYYPQIDYTELSPEEFELINIFREVMLADGKSDIEVIDLACNSFATQFISKSPYAIRDLRSLINIKKQHPDFSMKLDNKSYFSRNENKLCVDNASNIRTFEHEVTHAIHWYANEFEFPEKYISYMNLSSEQIKMILEFAKKILREYKEYYSKLDDIALGEQFGLPSSGYYSSYLGELKEKLGAAENDQSYSDGCIQYLKEKPISREEFGEHFRKVILEEIKRYNAGAKYIEYFSIEDIFDALASGNFLTGNITDADGQKYFLAGHGEEYFKSTYGYFNQVSGEEKKEYKDPKISFEETLASYVVIIKSPNASEVISILVDIMGQEFVDMLNEFYENLYVDDKGYKHVEGGNRSGP